MSRGVQRPRRNHSARVFRLGAVLAMPSSPPRDRDQFWAEAAHLEAHGESIRLPKELEGADRTNIHTKMDHISVAARLTRLVIGSKVGRVT
jgi:hypothetical protein